MRPIFDYDHNHDIENFDATNRFFSQTVHFARIQNRVQKIETTFPVCGLINLRIWLMGTKTQRHLMIGFAHRTAAQWPKAHLDGVGAPTRRF
jgi:hypothetical protein